MGMTNILLAGNPHEFVMRHTTRCKQEICLLDPQLGYSHNQELAG